jgi:hypothetical protein
MKVLDNGNAFAIVYATVDEVNKQLPRANRLEKTANTVLSGPGGQLDSSRIHKSSRQCRAFAYGLNVRLSEEVASDTGDHLHTIESFSEFVRTAAEKKCNG